MTQTPSKKLVPALGVAAVGILLVGCGTTPADTNPAPTTDEDTTTSVEGTAAESEHADGTYAATGHYTSPAGAEEVEVTVTLTEGVVTAATFEGKATHPVSVKRQEAFAQGFEEQVIGKPIEEISVGIINGSSLVSKGFMDALEKIEMESEAA